FTPDLRDPRKTRDTTVFAEYNLRTPRAKSMIRRGDFKYSYYTGDIAEMYNLREDPSEMRNLALETASEGKAAEMKAQLFAWHKPTRTGKWAPQNPLPDPAASQGKGGGRLLIACARPAASNRFDPVVVTSWSPSSRGWQPI